jgi:hypothetical protein
MERATMLAQRGNTKMRRILAGLAVVGLLAVASPAQAADFSNQWFFGPLGETQVEVPATIVTTEAGGDFQVVVYGQGGDLVQLYVDGPTTCEFSHCNAKHPVTNWDCMVVASGAVYADGEVCDFPNAPAGQWRLYVNTVDTTPAADEMGQVWVTVFGDHVAVS